MEDSKPKVDVKTREKVPSKGDRNTPEKIINSEVTVGKESVESSAVDNTNRNAVFNGSAAEDFHPNGMNGDSQDDEESETVEVEPSIISSSNEAPLKKKLGRTSNRTDDYQVKNSSLLSVATLIVEDMKIYFSRDLLAMCSPVFEKLLNGCNPEVKLEGKIFMHFIWMLDYLSPEKEFQIEECMTTGLLELAVEYKIDKLISDCSKLMCKDPRLCYIAQATRLGLEDVVEELIRWAVKLTNYARLDQEWRETKPDLDPSVIIDIYRTKLRDAQTFEHAMIMSTAGSPVLKMLGRQVEIYFGRERHYPGTGNYEIASRNFSWQRKRKGGEMVDEPLTLEEVNMRVAALCRKETEEVRKTVALMRNQESYWESGRTDDDAMPPAGSANVQSSY